ncbi:transport permease protein [Catellatospora sp. TT07R-123]|uniref:ABC transporter permease n=1 Tax=Catellatospora sp. TT07R-123 TaxID=2733863 RepID=UPI001B18245B|nr:ABC transporter permease [Catellatospora sp. TT07R-123]GHJ50429.1 transport permease protein [Catellatospora sp. TT07R-123]
MADAVVTEPYPALAPAQLAARHGLRVAGARPGLTEYVRRLWAYRHFIVSFANAKNIATFSSAQLGQLWHVLTPLTNAGVYFLIFGVILNTRHGIDNFVGFLCAGIFIFGYTQQVVTAGTKAISDNMNLIRALQFPRASLPIAATITQLQQMAFAMAVLLGIVVVTGEPITFKWLLLIPLLLLQSLFNAGMAMLFARLGSKILDLKQVVPFLLRTWLYASGVFFSLGTAIKNAPHFVKVLLQLNPMVPFIELTREILGVSSGIKPESVPAMWAVAAGWALLLSVGGFLYFWRGEKEYGRG